MKILALVGSYRKKGNTARLVAMIQTHMAALAARHDEPLEFETLYLGHMDLSPCRGCRSCFDRGEDTCPVQDDLGAIRARMDAADGILVASPIYVDDVNGITKNWIDRLAYACHRPCFAGKCVYLVATVGSGPTGHTLRTMNLAVATWGMHIVGQSGFKMGALMPQDQVESTFQQETTRIAAALYRAVSARAFLQPSFLSLMMFRIQQRAWQQEPPGSVDYAYWHDQGWLDPHRTFYLDHQAARIKVALARLTGSAMARFVS